MTSGSEAAVLTRGEWADHPDKWSGEVQLGPHGAGLCLIFNLIEGPGGGPRLHRHPYAETFVIKAGTGLFTVGDREIRAEPGHILVVPAGVPHKFTNLGPGPLETLDVHESGTFDTEWLE